MTDLWVGVGRDSADLGNGVVVTGWLGELAQLLNGGADRFVNAALQIHRVHTGGDCLHAFANHGLGQHGCSGGAVASDVRGLGSHFLDHLCTHVLQTIFELNFLGDGHAVLGDGGSAVTLFENDISALGAQCDFHGVGEDVDTSGHARARIFAKAYFFGGHALYLPDLIN